MSRKSQTVPGSYVTTSPFFTHLECSGCNTTYDHAALHTVCARCGKSLLARYDLGSIERALSKHDLTKRTPTLWRYRELLPVVSEENIVSLGEGYTPLIPLRRLRGTLGFKNLLLKDESFNATGSFKARGLSVAVSRALELGVKELCIPTAGNAGGALAAYAASAGLRSHVYLPDDTPRLNIDECRAYGADVHLVRGVISDAAAMMRHEKKPEWFDVSTLKEPYRLEGKKTIGFEIAEQMNWRLPDAIIYPTGGGTGLIGMWKAFAEMEQLGWIDSSRPKMVAVQSSGCAPIVRAYLNRASSSDSWSDADTIASGLRVPKAFADELILKAIYVSEGAALEVSDNEILKTIRQVSTVEGILLCPEGAATIAALPKLKELGVVSSSDSIVVFNTGSGLKYLEVLNQLFQQPSLGSSGSG